MDKSKLFGNDTLFARFMNRLGDMIAVGLLWLVTSLPVITMGAASCAAYQTTIKIVRGKSGGVFMMFFDVFKENLKITLLIRVLGTLFTGWLAFDIIYLYGYGTDFSMTLSIILYVVIGLYIALVSFLYPLISRFDEKIIELFKIAVFLTFRHFLSSILLVLITGVCIYLVYLMPWSIFIVPGLYWYLLSFPVKRALGLLASDKEKESRDEDWTVASEGEEDEHIDLSEGREKRETVLVKRRNLRPEDFENIDNEDSDEDRIIRKK